MLLGFTGRRWPIALLAFGMLAVAPARAHFIWIQAEPVKDDLVISAGFGEPGDWDKNLADKIKGATYAVRDAKGQETAVELKFDTEKGVYVGKAPSANAASVVGSFDYGVTKLGRSPAPILLKYHPKRLLGEPKDWGRARAATPRPVEVTATPSESGIRLVVLADGAPKPDAEIKVTGPKSDRVIIKTDARGEAIWPFEGPGEYLLFVGHVRKTPGKKGNESYAEVREYATLGFSLKQNPGVVIDRPRLADLPEAVTAFGAAAMDGWIYVYGGHTGKTHAHSKSNITGVFARCRADGKAGWEMLPSGPAAQSVALVAHKGSLYRMGGMRAHNEIGKPEEIESITEAARFDLEAKKWTPIPSLPEPRSSHDAVVVGDDLIVIGGWRLGGGDESWHTTTLVMDLSAKSPSWTSLPQPFERRALAVVAHGGKVHVLGGFTDENKPSLEVDIFDPASKSWSKGPKLPGPQLNGFACSGCVVDGTLYQSALDGEIHRLSPSGDQWVKADKLSVARFQHRMVPLGASKFAALGGANRVFDHLRSAEIHEAKPAGDTTASGGGR